MRHVRAIILTLIILSLSFSKVIEFHSDTSFYSTIEQSDELLVIDFYATWCQPCIYLAPILDSLSQEVVEGIQFYKINVEKFPAIARHFRVDSYPSVFFIHNQQVVYVQKGLAPKSRYKQIITHIQDAADSPTTSFQNKNAQEFTQLIQDSPGLILDVRTEREFNDGHIKEAQLIPVQELSQRIDEISISKETPIYVYCRSGNRSTTASNTLIKQGFTQVFNLSGGLKAWKKAGNTITK